MYDVCATTMLAIAQSEAPEDVLAKLQMALNSPQTIQRTSIKEFQWKGIRGWSDFGTGAQWKPRGLEPEDGPLQRRVLEQTCLLCHTADMSAASHSRHVCCVTQQTCLLCHAADMLAVSHSRIPQQSHHFFGLSATSRAGEGWSLGWYSTSHLTF